MAEVYATMDKAAADGMKTSSDKTAAVTDAWARVRSDATAIDWAAFVLEGKAYKLRAEGSGVPALLEALSEDCVTFAGFRADVGGAVKFFHLLYVGSGARVKELFESVEVFKVLHRRLDRGPRPARLFDLACGHGFVAHLAAAAFPATAVVAVDLEKRDAFDAWRAAFVAAGKAPCDFREESLTAVEADLGGDAMVVVVRARRRQRRRARHGRAAAARDSSCPAA
ncbi:hypothetical protein JL720_2443 [Aureococcus anophagefferens]|nr:hypothetical protein JL720_2443 [Aureococcus anophagefferens]